MNENEDKPDIYQHMDQPVFTPRVTHGVVEVEDESKIPEQAPRIVTEEVAEETSMNGPSAEQEVKVKSVLEPNIDSVPPITSGAPQEEQNRQNKSSKILKYVIVTILLSVSVFAGIMLLTQKKEVVEEKPLLVFSSQGVDSDNDKIPDNLEQTVGLNPIVSEFDRCTGNRDCNASSSGSLSKNENVQFLVSLSASMNLSISGETKIGLVKNYIKNLLDDSANSKTFQYGLVVFGNEGTSSSATKTKSCLSSETLAEIGDLNVESVEGYLEQLVPAGWSPVTQGVKTATKNFDTSEDSSNKLIIFTDKADTCNGLLENEIEKLKRDYKAEVYVVLIDPSEEDLAFFSDLENSLNLTLFSGGSEEEFVESTQELSTAILGKAALCNEQFFSQVEQCIFETKKTLGDFSSRQDVEKSSVLKIVNSFSQHMDSLVKSLKEDMK